jgi:hypothetical protein
MPYESPGRRYAVTATKQVNHGDPTVELNHAGVAAKSTQPPPMAPSVANAALAVQIAVGETFTIMMDGSHTVRTALLPVGYAVGTQLWITPATNALVSTAAAGLVKFGIIDSINAATATAIVNLSQRGSY